MVWALKGARVFDGETFLDGYAAAIEGARVRAVVPERDLDAGWTVIDLQGGLLCPGFIDCQVNGGGGFLLNETPDAATVRRIARAHARCGTAGLLPTVITDAPEVLARAIAAVRQARAEGERGVLGIHIEGPFIDTARKGAHAAEFIRELTDEDVRRIAAADCGAVMLTVAPNRVRPELIQRLADAGVRVSLGHAEASFAAARAALDAGATCFTHLYNAMSQMTGREPGMVGAALADAESYVGIIADGHHVHEAAMTVACRMKPDRLMLVSDAMPPAAGGPDRFELQGRVVTRVNGRLQLADGSLAGVAITMAEAVRHCVSVLKFDLAQVLRMASLTPARFLGRDRDFGRIAPGALASIVHLDGDLQVRRSWIEGKEVS